MKNINILFLLGLVLLSTACDNDLDQVPPNIATADSLTDFEGVLNAAYYYQLGSVTPLAVMGDFRADNAVMIEEPYPAFDRFNNDLLDMEDQFFEPFYIALYRSILSSNNIIANSGNATHVGEAKFLRALSYFKLVKVFGDVTINLNPPAVSTDNSLSVRQPAMDVYNNVIIPDLQDAIAVLNNSGLSDGRASQIAASALLGKVYMQMGDTANAQTHLSNVINDAAAANIILESNFSDVVTNESTEIIFATQVSSSIPDEYGFTEFTGWFIGNDSKSFEPLDLDLVAAFDSAGDVIRKDLTVNEASINGIKYVSENPDQDWIELRLADVILLYAEALNENTNANGAQSSSILGLLDDIRNRAGLNSLSGTASTQEDVRQVIADERRLELAFEGQRWFDLVRTGTVDSEMGETVNPNYHLFPVPNTQILASGGVITQNAGY